MKKILHYKYSALILVIALALGSCDEVIIPTLKDKNITLLAPSDGVISSDTAAVFYWEPVDSLQYELQVVSPRFDSIVSLITDTLTYKNQVRLLLSKGDYQWRVRAVNEASQGPYSAIWNLKMN